MKSIEKILVIGAHGKIGQLVCRQLRDDERYKPTAFIRKEEQASMFREMSVDMTVANLEDPVNDLTEEMKDFDCVIFAAGSGGDSSVEKTMAVDLDGAVRSMEAAEKAGVNRFIMVSASHSDDRSFWDEANMKPYYVAKHYADEMLRNSKLNYTILRPVMLTDNKGEGKINASFSPDDMNKKISREDVASTIIAIIDQEQLIRKTIEISSGDKTIAEALENIEHNKEVYG